MAEVAPAAPAAPDPAPAQAAKQKKSKPKPKDRNTPILGKLILKIVATSKNRGGMSLAALKKGLAAEGYDVDKNKARIRRTVKNLVSKGALIHVSGTGASGSFKICKTVDKKTEKKAAPKTKKSTAKRDASPKKPKTAAAKKSKAAEKVRRRSAQAKKANKASKKNNKKAGKKGPAAKKDSFRRIAKPKSRRGAPRKK